MSAFDTVLVANRGEIACRVLATARDRGFRTVAVFSPSDAGARHTTLADRAVALGAGDGAAPYLDIERILAAAERAGAQAIHPGYGFLAENAAFAEAVTGSGRVFVGPPPEAIRIMGSKRRSKRRMIEAGVPCVPGYDEEDQRLERLLAEAKRLGLPLMVKASAGGGGKGLRKVTREEDVEAALRAARAEAESAFGDGELILERALEDARHVEVQVFGDMHGRVLHLFERDCSVQRRHQKIVEEAPSPAVDPELRAKMGAAAVKAAEAVGYVGAGTVEMLLEGERFYFMEMNTRLQVEHPVTEMVTGLDLVGLQLDVAAGAPLPFSQDDLRIDGHAIEVRLYAEDPQAGFLPQTGRVRRWAPPELPGVRVDHGLLPEARVTADYDPMVAKIIAHGRTREEARRKLRRALESTVLHGLTTNQGFLGEVLDHPRFVAGEAKTRFVDETTWSGPAEAERRLAEALAAGARALRAGPGWTSGGGALVRLVEFDDEGQRRNLSVRIGEAVTVEGPDGAAVFERLDVHEGWVVFRVDGLEERAALDLDGRRIELTLRGRRHAFSLRDPAAPPAGAGGAAAGAIKAPMAGKIVDVRAANGPITAGTVVLVLEAMKMQLELEAPRGGELVLDVELGEQVASKQVVAEVREGADP